MAGVKKIGQDIMAKQEEQYPYVALGIAKMEDGEFALVELKIHGVEVLSRKVLKKASNYAEALLEYKMTTGAYGIRYLNDRLEGKK